MAFVESLDLFLADFGTSVSWSPSAGGATQIAQAIFERPDENLMGERVRSREYQLTLRSDRLQQRDQRVADQTGGAAGTLFQGVVELDAMHGCSYRKVNRH